MTNLPLTVMHAIILPPTPSEKRLCFKTENKVDLRGIFSATTEHVVKPPH
jgi:hypothetical protein